MRSGQNPTPAAAKETIRGTQQATEIGPQLAPVRIGVGSAACGRRSKCIHSTFAASPRRNVALGPPAGCFVFLSAQMQFPFTQHEKAFHCTHYGSHVLLCDNKVSYPLNPNPLLGGTGRETRRRFYGTGYQRRPAFHFKSDEPGFQPGRSHFVTAKPALGWRYAGSYRTVLFSWFRPPSFPLGCVEKQTFRGFP